MLTNGVGEHVEPRISVDGKRVVCTLLDVRQSIISIPLNDAAPGTHQVTDGHSGDLFPSVDFQRGRMVFSSSRSAHRNLWMADADGSHPAPLTSETFIDENPAFSPDGRQIAFVSDRGGARGIWIISAEGGSPRLLARETVLDTLTWSRDGRRVFFARPGRDLPSLASVSVDDGRVEGVGSPGAVAPAWSPTEDVLAFLEVTIIDAPLPATGTVSRMHTKFVDGQGTVLYPNLPRQTFPNGLTAWAPDGRRLAVLSIPANGPAQIWVVEPRGGQPLRKLVDFPPSVRPRGITWSKDGTRVLVANQDYTGDIVMYDVN